MIILDKALRQRQEQGCPIRVGMIGAGFMGRGIALQFLTAVAGMKLVAISNRAVGKAVAAYTEAGVPDVAVVENQDELSRAIIRGRCAVTENAMLLCESGEIDAIIEVTGSVEFAAAVALRAIEHGKHVILMNAELDGTVGPILKVRADKAGVVFTNADGDQPGVIMNLYRFVKGIGIRPVLCGNIKGLQDRFRTPATQAGFAKQWGQRATMVTSFADGTKISFEQAIVANAAGLRVAQRGMLGPTVPAGTPLREAVERYPLEILRESPGIVDYLVGAEPAPGVFVLGMHDHPVQQHYLNLYKLGTGPLYCFYAPYHLCHFEVPNTVARAALFGDATIASLAAPCVDVVATAKTKIRKGQILDGIGGYLSYGQCENSGIARRERLLPMGLAEGCRLLRDAEADQVLAFDDVELPNGRLCDRLWDEQNAYFAAKTNKEP
jgi:predicted homoserine dehydrogenase-like protein